MTLPAGYQVHPQDPQYMWNPSTNDVCLVQHTAPPPVPGAMKVLPSQVNAAQTYGTADPAAAGDTSVWKRRRAKDYVWLDFPAIGKDVGDEVTLTLRFLPPWTKRPTGHVGSARHSLPPHLVPDAGERKLVFRDCLDSIGGPGDCPIDRALKQVAELGTEAATKFCQEHKGKPVYHWQAVNLDDVQKHYAQALDADEQPIVDLPSGQPMYRLIPGLLRVGSGLQKKILKYLPHKGDFMHPNEGYALKLIKKRTGPARFDIEYDAIDAEPVRTPLHESLRPVLAGLVNLQETCVEFRPREEMAAIGNKILEEFGLGSMAGAVGGAVVWQPHPTSPGWEWNSQGQVRETAAPPAAPVYAAPVAPPPPPPTPRLVTAAPPVAPSTAPLVRMAAQHLPPPVAPGGVHAPAVGLVPPPPPPGFSPGRVAAPPPPPPSNGTPGLPPDEFERGMSDKLPF